MVERRQGAVVRELAAYRALQAEADELRKQALADFGRGQAAIDRFYRWAVAGWVVAAISLVSAVVWAVLR